VCT
jgi:hypothetical protein